MLWILPLTPMKEATAFQSLVLESIDFKKDANSCVTRAASATKF
jgi:hypothetical protein